MLEKFVILLCMIRRKYISVISLIICLNFLCFISIIYFPFLHNLDADLNIWNVKTLIILGGEHHHEDNPKSACFDYHTIKIIDIGECLICHVFKNSHFIFLSQSLNIYYKLNYSFNYFKNSILLPSNIYNLPLLRAPPLS